MTNAEIVIKFHTSDEFQHLAIHTLWSELLLGTLCLLGLNNYVVVQVIQVIAYLSVAVLTDTRFKVRARLHISVIVTRMLVATEMAIFTSALLHLDYWKDKNGDLLHVGFDKDLFPISGTWFTWRLTAALQTLIWIQWLSSIRLIALFLRLVFANLRHYNIRYRGAK